MHKTFSQTIEAEFSEVRAASTASGGTALTTTLGLTAIPFGANWVSITPRNFVGCGVARWLLNPRLAIIKTSDLLVSPSNFTDLSEELQDGDTTTVAMDAFDTAANGDFLYVGTALPFRGARVTVGDGAGAGDPQNTASVLTVNYWNGSAWTTISETDGTETGGTTTFAQNGNVTWTVPTGWIASSLVAIGDTLLKTAWSGAKLYWTRWEVDATTETTWTMVSLQALNRSTAYSEWLEGQVYQQAIQSEGPGGVGCVEALTDAGTANLVVNVATGRGEEFSS